MSGLPALAPRIVMRQTEPAVADPVAPTAGAAAPTSFGQGASVPTSTPGAVSALTAAQPSGGGGPPAGGSEGTGLAPGAGQGNGAGHVPAPGWPAPGAAGGVDVDRLIEVIEERVLAEVERRGGRYTGLF
ncbi:MAG TPA: hypothetical protein VGO87_13845 [Acidimicrobiia bacterium]